MLNSWFVGWITFRHTEPFKATLFLHCIKTQASGAHQQCHQKLTFIFLFYHFSFPALTDPAAKTQLIGWNTENRTSVWRSHLWSWWLVYGCSLCAICQLIHSITFKIKETDQCVCNLSPLDFTIKAQVWHVSVSSRALTGWGRETNKHWSLTAVRWNLQTLRARSISHASPGCVNASATLNEEI